MSVALEIRGLCKRYTVGAGSCLAVANVLCGADVVLHSGELLIVVGPHGSGKTTLLLCAAGLLAADAGELRWFGDSSRAAASRIAHYHHSALWLLHTGAASAARVHLIDATACSDESDGLHRWIERRCGRGDAALVATSDVAIARRLAACLSARVLMLRAGRLHPEPAAAARVAEQAHG